MSESTRLPLHELYVTDQMAAIETATKLIHWSFKRVLKWLSYTCSEDTLNMIRRDRSDVVQDVLLTLLRHKFKVNCSVRRLVYVNLTRKLRARNREAARIVVYCLHRDALQQRAKRIADAIADLRFDRKIDSIESIVLQRIAAGATYREVAIELNLSPAKICRMLKQMHVVRA